MFFLNPKRELWKTLVCTRSQKGKSRQKLHKFPQCPTVASLLRSQETGTYTEGLMKGVHCRQLVSPSSVHLLAVMGPLPFPTYLMICVPDSGAALRPQQRQDAAP